MQQTILTIKTMWVPDFQAAEIQFTLRTVVWNFVARVLGKSVLPLQSSCLSLATIFTNRRVQGSMNGVITALIKPQISVSIGISIYMLQPLFDCYKN